MLINNMLKHLSNHKFNIFEQEILNQLEGHNKLEEFQKKEKELLNKIKKLQTQISSEKETFQNEINEKNSTILKLKEQLNKTKTENMIKLKYQIKELETNEETEIRLYKQSEDNLLREKQKYEEIKSQEEIVFKRNKRSLIKENKILKAKIDEWTIKFNENRDKFDDKIQKLETKKNLDQLRLQKLKQIYEDEIENKKNEDSKIKEIFAARNNEIERESKKQEVITIIQYNFEKWFEKIGQFTKSKKRSKKSK